MSLFIGRQIIRSATRQVSHRNRPISLLSSRPLRPQNVSIPLRSRASFHSTPPTQGGPLIPIFASILKASAGFELARTASRVALTFIPLLWLHNMKSKKMIKYAAIHGVSITEEKKAKQMKDMRARTALLHVLLLIPFTLFWATIIASLERTPLTGRWRMILLSPEEEDEIASQLAGPGWYTAVREILMEVGSPKVIPPSDWRYQWIHNTLRRLEATLPILAREPELCPNWSDRGPGADEGPLPPPADFPLRPRPRASEYLRWLCDHLVHDKDSAGPIGSIPGPPYSLLLVDKPDASNAFSYGFGPDGGSGIVVYSGFLDDIFANHPSGPPVPESVPTRSFWSSLFGGLFSPPAPAPHIVPTEEQTAELAILLAHEMAHLILSHHLESLSSATVILPGTLSIASDVIRVLLFPFTMIFGPFVNDAVAQLGKVGSGELAKISEYCTSAKQEIEADVVSARILAYAGFDARDAVKFWQHRTGEGTECSSGPAGEPTFPTRLARQIRSESHPLSATRVDNLRDELDRWEKEREKELKRQAQPSLNPSSHKTLGILSKAHPPFSALFPGAYKSGPPG